MRLGKNRITAVLLMVSLLSAPVYAATNKDMDSAKSQISALEAEKKKTAQTIKNLEGLKSDTEAYVKALDDQMDAVSQERSDLSVKIQDKEAQIKKTNGDLDQAKQTEDKQYDSMKLRIKYMYEKGDSSFLDLLLQSSSLSDLLNRAEYISQISEYDRRMLDRYGQVKDGIARQESDLEAEKQELLELQDQTKAKQNSVKELLTQKAKELTGYQAQLTDKQQEASAYEKDIKAQEDKIRQIEADLKRQEEEARKKAEASGQKYNPVSIGNIKFIWPCPASSRISSGFGARSSPTEGASTFHKGIDIAAPTGTDILAAADGTVTIATYSYSAGNYIMLDHGGGVSTVYMHCSKLLVSPGDKVKQGQVIGKVGSTGYSTGSHLHFGVRVDGNYVDPSKYVSP